MKKKLESELVSIAHRILKLKGKEDVIKMHAEVSVLFEKLSVLKFLDEKYDGDVPTIGHNVSFFDTADDIFNKQISDTVEAEDNEAIMVPGIETIKMMVAQMPDEITHKEVISQNELLKNDFEDLIADFKTMPVFEPVSKVQNGHTNEKKSLNDKLKNGGLNIGLNDKLAFIKHLFEGKSEDYERVISQLNSFDSFENAKQFIIVIVKPDYNNWITKEDVEERFLQILESKYN